MKPLTRAIVWGGLLAGTGDLVFALSYYGMKLKVFQTVAAGLIGREAAFSGGEATLALGVALHYGISLIWAALFCIAALRLPALLRNATAAGLAYGFVVYFGMNNVVLPLSALHHTGLATQAGRRGHRGAFLPVRFSHCAGCAAGVAGRA